MAAAMGAAPDLRAVEIALRSAGACFAFVHGSRASGDARRGSDLDLAAWWSGEAPAAWEVPLPEAVDLLVLNSAPLELAGRVALDGEILFDDDPPRRVEWQARTRKIYLDEEQRQKRIDSIFLQRVERTSARRVIRVLQRIEQDLERLSVRGRADRASIRDDFDRLAAVKYMFVTAIEGCIDVAQHLCASESWGRPDTNADAVRELGRQGVIASALAEAAARAIGFRNVLVHGYAAVDDERVLAYLDEVDQLSEFVAEVGRWVAEREP